LCHRPPAQIIGALAAAGVYLEVGAVDVVVHGPAHLVTPALWAEIERRLPEFIEFLGRKFHGLSPAEKLEFGYRETTPRSWWDESLPGCGGWVAARDLWPNGFPAASQERSPLAQEDRGIPHATPQVLAAGTGQHDRDGAAREPAQSQGALW